MTSEVQEAASGPPLAGVKVIEIGGGVAAGFAGRQFAGYGADVVRVEGWEDCPPLTEYEATYLLAGKTRVTATAEEVAQLARAADVLIEDGRPGRLAAAGVPVDALRAANPALIVVSITPFGQTGPYRDYKATNIVSFAMGGIMSVTGDPQRHPLVTGGANQAQYWGGLHAFSAAVTALVGAQLQGEGDWIDLSLQACAAGTLEHYGAGTSVGGPVTPRLGNQTLAEWGIYPCLDGYIGIFTLQRQVKALFDAMGQPELFTPETWADPNYRKENFEELTVKLYEFTFQYTKEELLDIGRRFKVPIGAARTPGELLESAAFAERGAWDEIEGADGPIKVPGRVLPGFDWRSLGKVHEVGSFGSLDASWKEAVSA